MKTNKLFLVITILLLFVFSTKSFAQFEQKFTLQISSGIVKPITMSNYFKTGIPFNAGVQYNYNRSLSFVGLLNYVTLSAKQNFFDARFNTINISFCPKYRFMPESKITPYILGGLGFGYVSFYSGGVRQNSPVAFLILFGGGIDAALSDNFALFFQTQYSGGYINFQVGVNIRLFKV